MGVRSADSQASNKVHGNGRSSYNGQKRTQSKHVRGKHATAGFNSLLANLVNINDYALKETENQSRQMINNLESFTDGAVS